MARSKSKPSNTTEPLAAPLLPHYSHPLSPHYSFLPGMRAVIDPEELTSLGAETLTINGQFISGLSHLESGVHELRRAYISQFNTLLPENHPGRISLPAIPFFNPQGGGVPGAIPGAPPGAPPIVPGMPATAAAGPVAGAVQGILAAPEANMKRKRKPHDPHAPKRALTSYFLFMQHNKPAIKAEHPDWTAQQVSEESELRWQKIDPKERGVSDAHSLPCFV